jgi:putative RNA 2'-phosphotransferase
MEKELNRVSKYLSFILRHKPEAIGLELDQNGWARIDHIIEKTTDFELTHKLINLVVETNDKQRFAINPNEGKVRANQGHSINVNLDLEPVTPPNTLLHGTAIRFYETIQQQGLSKQKRHHVHLSESSTVAMSVGSRYGKPVLLEVDASSMLNDGYLFYKAANNVWLVDEVPAKYLNRL